MSSKKSQLIYKRLCDVPHQDPTSDHEEEPATLDLVDVDVMVHRSDDDIFQSQRRPPADADHDDEPEITPDVPQKKRYRPSKKEIGDYHFNDDEIDTLTDFLKANPCLYD